MYGMIHNGIRAMIIERIGEREWARIERRGQIGPQDFIGLTIYDDQDTLRLLGLAAEVLDLPVEECLQEFGRYWVRFAQQGPFGSIMDFTGRDLVSFIKNLDRMHRAVSATMPQGRMPKFTVVDESSTGLRVAYQSDREGLEPFVVGLLEGLLEKFAVRGTVSLAGRDDFSRSLFCIAY